MSRTALEDTTIASDDRLKGDAAKKQAGVDRGPVAGRRRSVERETRQ